MSKKWLKFIIIINAFLILIAAFSYIELLNSEKDLQDLEIETKKLRICILQIQLGEDNECL